MASYDWYVHLDATEHRLRGKGNIRWTNTSREPATRLRWHLYLNAFKNSETLFLRSPFGAGRSGDKAEHFGYIDVQRVAVREFGAKNLWPTAAPHSPEDPNDETDIYLPLPQAVEPQQTIVIDVEFEAQLPQIIERTGYQGSYHFVAQWFPKLARREPDGRWSGFAFHPQAEFYADFGDYHVTIDVPEGYAVGATGKLQKVSHEGNRKRLSFAEHSVIDFAWVAWDGFSTHQETIQGVETTLLYPPGYEAAKALTLGALRGALPLLNKRYGRYPYDTLTVVHPPQEASNSGGMEYPTLITTGSRWYTAALGIRDVEIVTVHELAHQWFYGLVASDEHTWPFLDEGLTSYAEGAIMDQLYGAGSLMENSVAKLSLHSFTRAIAAAYGLDDVVAKPAAQFTSFGSLGALVYQRTQTTLDTLGRVYGSDKLERALGRYARYYRYRHPGPQQLLAALEEVLGDGAASNFQRAIFERGFVDYVAQGLNSVPESPRAGLFDAPEGRTSLTVDETPRDTRWLSRAVITRHGNLSFPVDIELGFADGSRVTKRWNGEGFTHTLHHEGPARLVSLYVDPQHRVTLDANLLNNAMRHEPDELQLTKSFSLGAADLALVWFGP